MKIAITLSIIAALSALSPVCPAQTANVPAPTLYSIVHREQNERTWQRSVYSVSPSGQVVSNLESYQEVGNGICYLSQNGEGEQWLDSQDVIRILNDGTGAATNSPCKAYFPSDIYNGVITFVTADGLQLQSEPLGLWYSDGTNSIQIAAVTNSVGELVSSNEILYPGAFVGDLNGDLLLTFRRSGLEQDAIIRSQPAFAPQQAGLNNSCTRLQLVTEFVNSPSPIQSASPVNQQDNLQDTTLIFGSMKMIEGRAFQMGTTNAQTIQNQTCVYKSWTTTSDGRALLIEQVPWQRISAQLAALPASASRTRPGNSVRHRIASRRVLPPRRPVKATAKSLRLARADFTNKRGLDFDYITLDSAETNFTFCGDTTYLIGSSGAGYYLDGTTTIEGGTIIKFPNVGEDEGLLIIGQDGTLNCQTAPFRPAVFTSENDNSVGQSISGSTGSPGYEDNLWCLQIDSTNVFVHDLRFCYAWMGIGESSGADQETTINATNCQFLGGDVAVYAYNANLYNVLIGRSTSLDAAVLIEGTNVIGENITAAGGYAFVEADAAGASVALTNCLVTGQALLASGGSASLSTNAVAWVPSPSAPVYQTVGEGNYYLTNGSPYRQAGTTNIDPGLLADLATRTTWPPIVYSNATISVNTVLGPQAPRDISSAPDLGYNYDCLDYVFGGCNLSSVLTFTAGTTVGWFEDNADANSSDEPYGISLNGGANLSFNGNATQPCIFTRYPMVQEGGNGSWTDNGWMGGIMFASGSPAPELSGNFTKLISDTWNGNIFRDNGSDNGLGGFRNCEFYDFTITTYDMSSLIFTNCLFFRLGQTFWTSPNLTYENCTFYNGGIYLGRSSPVNWLIENCTFDGTGFAWDDSYHGASHTIINYNAYNTNNLSWETYPLVPPYYGTNEVVGANDLLTTNYNWQTSFFGNFYLSPSGYSPLIGAGSTGAEYLGLYWFTTQTNSGSYEGNSTVDIGYHYVTTDQYGNPLDNNSDGIPNYLEDINGNGVLGSGEIDWNASGDIGLSVFITQPPNGSTLP